MILTSSRALIMWRLLLLLGAGLLLAPASAYAISIDTVPIGDPGNPPDVNYHGYGQFGTVSYSYRIGTYEVTNAQYLDFLNHKATSDPLQLWDSQMADSSQSGGIIRSGSDGSYTYALKPNMGNKPVNQVNWYDAVRFINWLNNGQGNGDTESGAYTLFGGTPVPSNATSISRNANAIWFLPNQNEWYKAAFYQPAAQGGDSDNYWLYATRSNSPPTIAHANAVGDIDNSGENVANYRSGVGWSGGNTTSVGSAGPLSASFYGTFDQDGNLSEWNEDAFSGGVNRGVRGGNFNSFEESLRAEALGFDSPGGGGTPDGFRVGAYVPEPSSLTLAAFGLITLAAYRWRRKCCCEGVRRAPN